MISSSRRSLVPLKRLLYVSNHVTTLLEPFIVVESKEVPQQLNGSDCGVFACIFAEFLSRDAMLDFTQDDITLLRRVVALEILDCKLQR